MNEPALLYRDTTERIIGVFWDIVHELGTGFTERIYHRALMIALPDAGLKVTTEVPVRIMFRGQSIGTFCFDLIIEDCVLLELKAVNAIEAKHHAQVLGYLRASALEVGLILNFGTQPGVRRLIMTNDRKRLPVSPAVPDQAGA